MKCNNCGAEVPEHFTNCLKCGESMIDESGISQPQQTFHEHSSPDQSSPGQYSTHSAGNANESSGNSYGYRKNKNRTVLYGVLGVVALIIISMIAINNYASSRRNASIAESYRQIANNTTERNLSDSPAPNDENRTDHADSPEPPPEPPPQTGELSILLNKPIYAPGESVRITVTGITQEMLDAWPWVGIFHAGDSNDAYGRLGLWAYLTSTGTETVTFTLPSDTGDFELRFFNDSGHNDEAFELRVPFKIEN